MRMSNLDCHGMPAMTWRRHSCLLRRDSSRRRSPAGRNVTPGSLLCPTPWPRRYSLTACQAADCMPPCGAANPGCRRLSAGVPARDASDCPQGSSFPVVSLDEHLNGA